MNMKKEKENPRLSLVLSICDQITVRVLHTVKKRVVLRKA